MTTKHFIAAAIIVGFSFSFAGTAFAAENEELAAADLSGVILPRTPVSSFVPQGERPAILPALYATLGVMQAWDIYSTRSALNAGARESNPTAAPFAGNMGSMVGLKVATTAGVVLLAERMWKKNNKVAAIATMIAINGVTAAVSMRNMRNAKMLSTR